MNAGYVSLAVALPEHSDAAAAGRRDTLSRRRSPSSGPLTFVVPPKENAP